MKLSLSDLWRHATGLLGRPRDPEPTREPRPFTLADVGAFVTDESGVDLSSPEAGIGKPRSETPPPSP